jgi:hypothetical protein
MPKLIAQHPIAVALVGAVALLAVLLALWSFAAGASGRTVAYHPPLWRNTRDLAYHPPLWRNTRDVASVPQLWRNRPDVA